MVDRTSVPLNATLAVVILAAGCGGQNASTFPSRTLSNQYGAYAQPNTRLDRSRMAAIGQRISRRSRIDSAAKRDRLLYIADPFANEVLIYTYPQLSGAGYLSGFTSVNGVCTDRRGYVWVLDTSDVLAWEFPHGGTEAINALRPGDTNGNPGVGSGCSVDPNSGNLAVAGAGAGITIFLNGQSTHATYWDYNFASMQAIGYDGTGDLYVDGRLQSDFKVGFAELAKGSGSLNEITLAGGSLLGPGGIQWDGKYLDIGDSASGSIYQTDGTTILNTITTGATCQGNFYILSGHKRIVVPDPCSVTTGIYAYPAGGTAMKTVSGGQQLPEGAAVSRGDN